ncbi:MAG: HTH domain-containing protein [Muribaculaceae bacterium]|nr:HTH domain-containing protein [Muribaculaceae bacterium]
MKIIPRQQLANADFYGRRGVVVQKGADGFKFANPGSMRVSLAEAIQDSASDPRNGVMMKMLAMVKYGERAGSGLQGIFKTWQSVYHCVPKLEVTTSGGVDRTTLTLGFEGHQPDIEAMKLLYDNPDELIEVSDTPESKGESNNVAQKGGNVAQNVAQTDSDVAQGGEYVAQNLDDCIVAMIQERPNVKREEMARHLSVTKKTVERHLKDLGISWEGHPKTGHWKLP